MSGFKKFLLRGNVVDLAVAVVIGMAFTAVVGAIVTGLITPLVGAATGGVDVSARTFSVGGVDVGYGLVLQAVLNFLIVAAVVYFLVVKPVERLMDRFKTEPEAEAPVKECPECLSKIPQAAARCAFCTVEQLDVV